MALQETPGEGFLRKNSHTGLFLLPSCAKEGKGISHSAECDKGLCPLTPQAFKKAWAKFHLLKIFNGLKTLKKHN